MSRPRCFDSPANAGPQMDPAVIHHDDVVASGASEPSSFRHRRGTSLRSWHLRPPSGRPFYCDGRAATKVIVSHLPSGQRRQSPGRFSRGARPLQSHHVRADGGLVDKHPAGQRGSSIPCSTYPAPGGALAPHICSLPFGCLQHFLSVMLCRSRKTPERAAAGFDPSLAQFCNRFYQASGPAVNSGRSDP